MYGHHFIVRWESLVESCILDFSTSFVGEKNHGLYLMEVRGVQLKAGSALVLVKYTHFFVIVLRQALLNTL